MLLPATNIKRMVTSKVFKKQAKSFRNHLIEISPQIFSRIFLLDTLSSFDCYVTSCLCIGSLHDFTRLQKPDLIRHTGIQGSSRSDLSRKKEGAYILNVKSVQRSRYLVYEASDYSLKLAANRNSENSYGHLFCPYEGSAS